jgi:hypothetical protein
VLNIVVTLGMAAYIAFVEPDRAQRSRIYMNCTGILGLAAFALYAWGGIWQICIAFREELVKGILYLFLPFYCLYYLITRWHETRGAFVLSLAPVTWIVVNLGVTIGLFGVTRVYDALSGNSPQASQPAAPGNDHWSLKPGEEARPVLVERSRPADPRARGLTSGPGIPPGFGRFPGIPPGSGPPPGIPPGSYDPEFAAKVPRRSAAAAPSVASRDSQPGPPGPALAPDPEIPADADPIPKSLIQLNSADLGKKKQAIERLQRSTPDGRVDQVIQALLPLLGDDDGFLVSEVIKTLAVWRAPEAVPALIERTRDNRGFVRSEAIRALGKYPELRTAEAIVAQLKEERFAAESALKEMGPVAEPAVIPALKSPDPDLRRLSCEILRQIGGQETLKAMQAIPPDPDLGVRMAAQETWKQLVARVGPPPKPARGSRTGAGTGSGTGTVPRR